MDKQKSILIVDDVTTNLKMAADVLQDTYRLAMAKSGAQALEYLKKARPDLILLDIRMPEMDGYETLQAIKSNPETASIPVVFLTVDKERESEIKGLKMGAMDFIRKPFEPDVMKSRIEKILKINELRRDLFNSARKDPLTNLWNLKYLEDDLYRYFSSEKHEGVFIELDIDNFRSINDTFGHIAGDSLLTEFAAILESRIGPRDILARIGGDEFVIFLKGEYSTEEIKEYCQDLLEISAEELGDMLDDKANVSVSIGVAFSPYDGSDYETLHAKADKAIYFVKQNGKNSFHIYRERNDSSKGKTDAITSKADIERLERMIAERNTEEGAFKVEYEGFKHIYQFVSRSVGRTDQSVYMLLITLNHDEGTKYSNDDLNTAMRELERSIVVSVRQGDVTTRYSSFQYVVMLMCSDYDSAKTVSDRILATWTELNECEGLYLDFALKCVDGKEK
ncbi:MAG: diguanylate cyclase [Lachnospiraceae bacterium]|nr:diguanylate cyclase [Lachnospiraceae bacterium]